MAVPSGRPLAAVAPGRPLAAAKRVAHKGVGRGDLRNSPTKEWDPEKLVLLDRGACTRSSAATHQHDVRT